MAIGTGHGLLAAIVRSSHDAIISTDLDGIVTTWNRAAEQLYGYPADEIIGRRVDVLYPPGRRDDEAAAREYRGVTERVRRDGTTVTVSLSTSPILDDNGQIVGLATIARQRLREKRPNKVNDAFLSSLSHELRTPLNAIIGFTGTLLMGLPGPLNEAQTHQLQLVETSSRHLLSLINDLVDLARIESGKVEIAPELIDCCEVAREVARSMRPVAEQRGVVLATDLPAGPRMARADRRALGQILANLVDNAIKCTGKGEVHLELTGDEPVTLQVRDTTWTAARGTALGLYVSHRLAELMGVEISVDGSTFSLTLAA